MQTFDFIVVGAGSAGCVLADRLSQSGRYSVLVVEAGGGDRRLWIQMPLGYGMTYTDPAVNWCFTAAPDEGLNGREMYWPRGRVVGGSSSINAMAYIRGMPHDFDDWAAAGATGWGWETAQAVFSDLEKTAIYSERCRDSVDGEGPVHVTIPGDRVHPFMGNFLQAAEQIGWDVRRNLNATNWNDIQGGLGVMPATMRDGRRWSCADAFLRPALKRSNVTLITNAVVERLRLDGRRVVGLEMRRRGQLKTIMAAREVIVSAGAVNSPQLLQLSGIGPAAHLQSVGVEVRHGLEEVGRGLQDHLTISYFFRSAVATLNNRLGSTAARSWAGATYLATRRGPLSAPINQCGGFARTSADQPAPDVQIFCNPASYLIRKNGVASIDSEPGYLLCVQPCRPTSRGSVMISAPDPAAPPKIDPNSLSTEEDRRTVVRAGRVLQQLAKAPALAAVTRHAIEPDPDALDDDGLLADFRARSNTGYHPTCTCRMGEDGSNSVLDARLRVHGLGGVRVVDASSFPNVTSGNTNAPTIMLAARAAELILQDAAEA